MRSGGSSTCAFKFVDRDQHTHIHTHTHSHTYTHTHKHTHTHTLTHALTLTHTHTHTILLYSAYAIIWQQLCNVRVYVDCTKINKFYFLFHTEIMAAQLCVVKKMYFPCLLFFPFTF